MRAIIASSALAALVLSASVTYGQADARIVPDQPTCSRCVINLRQLLTLKTGDSTVSWIPGDVLLTQSGAVYVIEVGELPRRFSRDGQFLGVVGTAGRGPNEFAGTVGLAQAPGDSTLAVQIDGRVLVIDPSGVPRREVTLPTPLAPLKVVEWPSRVLATGFLGSPEAAGFQMHVLDLSGPRARVLTSFGWERGRMVPGGNATIPQNVSTPKQANFWMSDPLEYRLARWSASGQHLAELRRSPEWFRGRSQAWIGNPNTPPPPSVIGIAEDTEGLLWVYIRVPRANWRAGWPRVQEGVRELSSRSIDFAKLFEVQVEVIDPDRGRVVARQMLREFVFDVLDNGDLVTYRTVADGLPEISVLRPRLTRP
ncbi:hypothetical protein Strain138_000484 [Pseudogemmatithrix spongiicola]|uniref:6-bladed beta-propeller n=1 Tax=Pseudogemmatithrix spongiicola TaxID=3062599 RepID=A0AA49Q682_9BACT|nr:hypothetical protein Strain138_000484 [Gemmatimonadaceae bacterium 'strain 138']WKW14158.1 hypothetical protein Strain318_000484 [Gemmatimonadaceae bacterium 'strain 318']